MEHQHTELPVRRQEEKRILGIDPVCGMKVFEKPDAIHRVHEGASFPLALLWDSASGTSPAPAPRV